MSKEVEVFRLPPIPGKYYDTATYTRTTGSWINKNQRYYTTNPLIYAGKFIKDIIEGFGDGATGRAIFERDDGTRMSITYTYEGTTCFREVGPPIPPFSPREHLYQQN
jgi:hypothetical protein